MHATARICQDDCKLTSKVCYDRCLFLTVCHWGCCWDGYPPGSGWKESGSENIKGTNGANDSLGIRRCNLNVWPTSFKSTCKITYSVCVYSNGVTCACTWDKYGDIWMTFAHRSGWCTCHKRAAGAVQAVSSTPPRHRPQQTITWVAKSFWDKPIWGAGPSSRWYLYLGMLPKCTRLWQAPQCVATKASKQNDSQICQICQGAPVGILNVFEVGYDGILLNDSE